MTGGNGFLGRSLIPALQERGYSVRVFALPTEDTLWLEQRGVAIYRGDICTSDILTVPMRGVDVVFHLAAMMGAWRPMQDYQAVNVIGTENVCRAALAGGVRRFIHISSAMVYNMAIGRPATENDPLAPLNEPYSMTKAEGDQLVQRLIDEDHFPAVIIRPGTLFGPGDHLNFARIADRMRAGKAVIIGSGGNALPLVFVTDLVQGLLLAMHQEQAVGQAYNIGNDRPLTQEAFLSAIAHEIGAPPPRIHIPYYLLYAAAYIAERLATFSHNRIPPFVTRHGVKLYGADNQLSIAKARRDLGYAPQVPLREGVRLAAAWYQGQDSGTKRDLRTAPRRWKLDRQAAISHTLVDEVAIVTGASSGIGAATARELALRGARVVLAARRADELEAHAQAITEAGGRAIAVPTDVTDPAQVMRLVERTREAFGRVDVLVNNAGANWVKSLADTSADEIARLLQVNLLGAMLLVRSALPEMQRRRHGVIISVGSVASHVAIEPLYSATKFGMRGFSLALRRQLTGSGISVSLVTPGNIRTGMTNALPERMPGPELVATTIASLIVHPRREVIVPRKYHAIVLLDQLLPWMADFIFQWRHRRDRAQGLPSNLPAYARPPEPKTLE